MNRPNLGNSLFHLVTAARHALVDQGEFAQLTHDAFDLKAKSVNSQPSEDIEVSFPIGYRPDKTTIPSTRRYSKQQLFGRYQYLAYTQLPLNGLAQLVTITEALLGDLVREIVVRYPHKLGGKRAIQLQAVLEAQSLEEVHIRATDALLNELSYKSPSEFALQLNDLISVNLQGCTAFHKYIELKATRDIHVHNRGIVNETYLKKAGSHARAGDKANLPVDVPYFLESYEACLQLTEWLEVELDQHWHSSEREQFRAMNSSPAPLNEPVPDAPEAEAETAVLAAPKKSGGAPRRRSNKP